MFRTNLLQNIYLNYKVKKRGLKIQTCYGKNNVCNFVQYLVCSTKSLCLIIIVESNMLKFGFITFISTNIHRQPFRVGMQEKRRQMKVVRVRVQRVRMCAKLLGRVVYCLIEETEMTQRWLGFTEDKDLPLAVTQWSGTYIELYLY